jgi:4-hydroxythreonine-4-phosphate dehydrogenase
MRIGITAGDCTGIGPEVVLEALAREARVADDTRFLVIGDLACLDRLNSRTRLPLQPFLGQADSARFCCFDPRPTGLPPDLPPGAPAAAQAAVDWLREGTRRCLTGELAALVTAPVNKAAIIRAGISFVGQTELLADLSGTAHPVMMLLGTDERGRWLRVALATTHLPLHRVAEAITHGRVASAIERASRACLDLGLGRARVGVCGLNPHAGEEGQMGTEELTAIRPAVEAARARGLDVSGPLAADALFHSAYRGEFDAVVAMYHDQGLAPLKLIAFDTGVNWTLGLPFIRTAPDHGTAYDLVGQDRANPLSMWSAIQLAKQLARPHRSK